VVTFSSILVVMVIAWVTSLLSTSAGMVSKNSATGDLGYVSTTFSADATSAVVCDPAGLGVPYYTFSSTQVGFYEPSSVTSGAISLVLWQYSSGQLQRAEIQPSSGSSCSFDTSSANWVTVASSVSSAQFTPWYQGSQASYPATPTSGGSCAGGVGTTNEPDMCIFDSVELSATIKGVSVGAQGASSSSMDETYPVSLADSKLG